ncbi:MAG: NADPH-dependent glutamate synthase [Bacillota bacterium]|nr:NADPH-dependent glutamate synthase [Bacillota bacterium]
MPNMSPYKVKIPEQPPEIRNKNFLEVSLGYTCEMAKEEAQRCLQCKTKPCMAGCPVNVKIPDFILHIACGEFEKAYEIINETNRLPAICGRVCPQESQCEKFCVRGVKGEPVGIGRLERFAADWYMSNRSPKAENIHRTQTKVAVIGSGPAGLTCAGDLAGMGYDVTIFEAFHTPGGVLMYGIPEFRLPKDLVQKEIENLKQLGVKINTNMVIGKVFSLEELQQEGYQAIFIGSGAGLPNFMGIPGENLNGVYSSNEFLTRINLMKAYRFPQYDTPVRVGRNVAVIGGGNVAMDAARSAKRLGAEKVYIVYRRSEKELPARLEEVHHAREEGIIFKLLTNPTQILGTEDGWVQGMECVEMELGEPDKSGRRRPIEKKNSKHVLDVDIVIIAIGQSPNPLIKSTTQNLDTYDWGGIIAEEATGATSIPGIYAGGDAVTGAATVILAMGSGKNAAKAIDQYLKRQGYY